MQYNFSDVTLYDFKKLVREIADEKPSFRYNEPCGDADAVPRCFYHPTERENGQTSRCIIGDALSRLGISDETMKDHEKNLRSTNALQFMGRFGFTDDVCEWADLVQQRQDRGYTWGDAARTE